jgi:hypothetical protein
MKIKRGEGRINQDYGMYDFHKYYNRNNNYKLTKKEFADIISEMNLRLQDFIIEKAFDINLPARMGELGIRKEKRAPKIINGKVVNNAPPNWKETLNLWREDPKAEKDKVVIRHNNMHTNGYVFRIFYRRAKANYKNKSAYYFEQLRDFKRKITKSINDYTKPKYDGIILYKKN